MPMDSTVAVDTGIDNYDFLKFVDGNFLELVSHYVNSWQVYHQVFTKIAVDLVMFGGIAWVGVLALKSPVDKLRTAAGAMVIVILTGLLLQPGNYNVGPKNAQVGLAAGAGYTLNIVGSIYQLFKSGLDSVNTEGANSLAFNNAYHVTNEGTVARYKDSPLAPMMNDYIQKCQNAVEQSAGMTQEVRKTGWAVGLFGSSGIGQAEAQFTSSAELLQALESKDKDLTKYMDGSDGGGLYRFITKKPATEGKIRDDIAKGIQMLNNIPDDMNPFFDGKTPTGGYQLPTKAYFEVMLGGEGAGDKLDNAVGGSFGNTYQYGGYTEGSPGDLPADQAHAFYPKNCAQMYLLVAKGVANYNAAAESTGYGVQKYAYMRDGITAQALMTRQITAHIAQEKLKNTSLQNIKAYAGQLYKGQEEQGIMSTLADGTMNTMQDLGKEWSEWMLKFKIPTMINGCAMLAGMLIVLFPLICIFAVFMSPNILISYVKLLVFAFTVPFINDLCLTMASSLLSMNSELLQGFNAGNYTENWALLISAGSAQYVIFIALTAVEIIIAKMLIWDDVKGLSGFNPAGAATGMAATGLAITGAMLKAGSMVVGGGKSIVKDTGKAAGGGAAGGANTVASITSAYGNQSANYTAPKASSGSRNSIGLNPAPAPKPPTNNGGGSSGGGGSKGGASNSSGTGGRTPPATGGSGPSNSGRTAPGQPDQTPPVSAGKYPNHPRPPEPDGPKKP